MDKFLFRMLMWIWVRRAKWSYGDPGVRGELFTTAGVLHAIGETTGRMVGESTAAEWLRKSGYWSGYGGCHWFDSQVNAEKTMERESNV